MGASNAPLATPQRCLRSGLVIAGARVLLLGLSFKENCPDLRNTKVVDLVEAPELYGMDVNVVDPSDAEFTAVIAAVAHRQFQQLRSRQWRGMLAANGILLDLKGIMPRELRALRL